MSPHDRFELQSFDCNSSEEHDGGEDCISCGAIGGRATSMELDEHRARMILDQTHAAWSRGDVEGLLRYFVDDVSYFCNTGGPDGGPLEITGKQPYGDMLK